MAPLRFLQLLADEQRWQLVRELARSDRKVSELTALIGKPQNLVSYHLAGLRAVGIVAARRSSADGRDTYYRLDMGRCADLLSQIGPAIQPGLCTNIVLPAIESASPSGRRPSVLFLCTGNSARSQMAEAMLEHEGRGAIVTRSAGSTPRPLHPLAVRVMAGRGIDISGRRSKRLDRFTKQRFDRVITLCDRVREVCPEFPGAADVVHWSMPDPSAAAEGASPAGAYDAFVRTADELEARLPFLIAELMPHTGRRSSHGHQ